MASSPMVRLNVALTAASPRARQNLVDALRFLMMTTRYDPGCVECSVWEDGDGTVRYTEVWATELDMRRRVGAEPFTSLQEQPAIRVEHIVRLAAPECSRHELDCTLTAFDFHESADGRFIERDRRVFGCELLAKLLIPEPDVQTQSLEHAYQNVPVADDGFMLLARFHAAGLHGTLERQQAPA